MIREIRDFERLLLIDREEKVRQELGNFLRKKKLETIEFDDCSEAIKTIEAAHGEGIDLIIIDAEMECLREMKFLETAKEFNRELPVVIIAGEATVKKTAEALKAGASDFITKPLNLDDVYNSILRILEMKRVKKGTKKILPFVNFAIEANFPSSHDYIYGAIHYLTGSLSEIGLFRQGEISNINLALYEAIANAIDHGNKEDLKKNVMVKADINNDQAVFKVSDEGDGFNIDEVPDPTNKQNIHNPRGRGLYLMKNFMDDVSFNRQGNEVTMFKRKAKRLKINRKNCLEE